jgi:glycine/D-amino acid oxidase-like deaminating enzyme
MDLRSGHPWWLDVNARLAEFVPLDGDLRCDIAILGAGITGALLALELTARGLSVVVLDKREAGRGSTAASTALLLVETDADFGELSRRFGRAAATRIWRLGEDAIERIAALARRLPFDIGFARTSSLYLASDRRGLRRLRAERDLRSAAGFEVELLQRADLEAISSLPHRGALKSAGAVVDPYRLTLAALVEAAQGGARIHDRTNVTSFEETASGVRIETDRGARVEAGKLVIAAGYESAELLKLRLGRLRSSYAFVSQPLAAPVPGWPPGTMLWETARPYLYVRPTSGGRVIAGGADSSFSGDHRAARRLAARVHRIERRLSDWLPEARIEVAGAWAGTFGESRDALPWIGRVPGAQRIRAALGFGGNGITFAAIAARLLAGDLLGRPDEDLALFAFER